MQDTFVLKGGVIVNAHERFSADVLVHEGVIAAVGKNLSAAGVPTMDVGGCLVLPGAVDVHAHLEFPFNSTVSADDYYSGTRAAACGGVTTVFDFAVQGRNEGILETVRRRDALCASKACVDYAFHVALTHLTPAVLEEFTEAVRAGFPSFKLFMVYRKDGLMMSDAEIYAALGQAREKGALISVHAENPDMLEAGINAFVQTGRTDSWHHYLSRPEAVESEAVKRALHWAAAQDTALYIVHLSSDEGLRAIAQARHEGQTVFAETCPHYLHFTREVYHREDGRNFVCSPPMKGEESQKALWRGIEQGHIQVVATDHCPFTQEQKDWGKDDFSKIPNGCMGIEILYPFMLHHACKGRISFEKAVALCSRNPARIFGCEGKGAVLPGKDADLVIYDPSLPYTVRNTSMHSNCDYTIWEGMELAGSVLSTYARGRLVWHNGEFLGQAGWGRCLRRGPVGLEE